MQSMRGTSAFTRHCFPPPSSIVQGSRAAVTDCVGSAQVSVRLPAHAGSAALGPTRLGTARNSQAFAVATRRVTASRLVQLRRSCAIALTAA